MRHAAARQVLANPKCEQGTRAKGGQKATRKQAHEQARAAGPLGRVDKARRKAGRATEPRAAHQADPGLPLN